MEICKIYFSKFTDKYEHGYQIGVYQILIHLDIDRLVW